MFNISIQVGNDRIQGKSVGSNRWQFWLHDKRFNIDSSDAVDDAIEILADREITVEGKLARPNVWTAEYSFYGASSWGTVYIQYTLQGDTATMKGTVKTETNADA